MTPSHDDLYVVSDLHIGDRPERSIFQDTARLAAVITSLAERERDRDVALVLAGDVVDFLAQAPARRFDPEGAEAKLTEIVRDHRPVFDALKVFTAGARRRLVVLVGNHDVELALPPVTELLLDATCDGEAARGRVHLALDGVGYRCEVGGRSVFVVHGNEVDGWNVVDHEAVRRAGAAMLRGLPPPAWDANPGSTLVVEVMNAVKQRHPFVDMLKPEDEGLLGVLLAIDPSLSLKALKLPTVAARAPITWLKKRGWLSADAPAGELAPGAERATPDEEALIAEALRLSAQGVRATDARLHDEGTLRFGAAIAGRVAGREGTEALRDAMARWQERTRDTFHPLHEDDTARALDAAVSPDVDVLIAGHTHVRRAQVRTAAGRRSSEPAWYFNSGTWITMFDIPPALLADAQSFEPLWHALQGRTPRELLAMERPVVRRMGTVVRVRREGARVVGELVEPDAEGRSLSRAPGTAACEFLARR